MARQAGSSVCALLRTWASWWKGPEVDFQKIKLEAKGEHQAARPSLRTPSLWPLCLHNPNRPPTPGWFIQSRNLRAAFLWALPQQPTTGVGLVIDTANSIFRLLLGQPGLRERTLCRCKYTYKGWEMSFHGQGQWPWKLDQAKCVRSNDVILPFLHAFVCPWLMIEGNIRSELGSGCLQRRMKKNEDSLGLQILSHPLPSGHHWCETLPTGLWAWVGESQ